MPKNPFRQVEKALEKPKPKPKPKAKAKASSTKKAEPRKATMFLKAQSVVRNRKK